MQGGYGGGPPQGGGWGPPQGGAPPGGGWAPPQGGQPPTGAPPGSGYGAPPGGGYGPPQGGGYGPPQGGGYGPPQGGGYGPPPGGGYGGPPPGGGFGGPPQGGGWAPMPQGGNPGSGGFDPYGPPAGPPATGLSRFLKGAAVGGAVGGILSAIPLLNYLNCCFCLLGMGGAVLSVHMYLREYPHERLSNGEAAAAGAMSGAFTGFIASVLMMFFALAVGGSSFASMGRMMPAGAGSEFAKMMASGAIGFVITVPLSVILFGAFGALGGVLGMSLFFNDRAKT